jgi:hypothetical protein
MSDEAKEGLVTVRGDEVDLTTPKYPRVIKRRRYGKLLLETCKGCPGYEIPEDPVEVLWLLHHLAEKRSRNEGQGRVEIDKRYLLYMIRRVMRARGWGFTGPDGLLFTGTD